MEPCDIMRESEGRLECLNADKLQMDWPAATNLSSSFGLLVLGFRSVSVCNRFLVKLLKLIDNFVSSLFNVLKGFKVFTVFCTEQKSQVVACFNTTLTSVSNSYCLM